MSVPERQAAPALLQVDSILSRLKGRSALAEVCRFLRAEFPHYSWVGVYRLDGEQLRLEAWEGLAPTEHTTIPLDRGLCGAAVRENRTVRVGDVTAAPEYLSCFADTRSEIVVPIRDSGQPIGEVDIDGTTFNAYDASDERFLAAVAAKLPRAVNEAAADGPLP